MWVLKEKRKAPKRLYACDSHGKAQVHKTHTTALKPSAVLGKLHTEIATTSGWSLAMVKSREEAPSLVPTLSDKSE